MVPIMANLTVLSELSQPFLAMAHSHAILDTRTAVRGQTEAFDALLAQKLRIVVQAVVYVDIWGQLIAPVTNLSVSVSPIICQAINFFAGNSDFLEEIILPHLWLRFAAKLANSFIVNVAVARWTFVRDVGNERWIATYCNTFVP
jgi:hypothetical protein